jgi:hypothetical protein
MELSSARVIAAVQKVISLNSLNFDVTCISPEQRREIDTDLAAEPSPVPGPSNVQELLGALEISCKSNRFARDLQTVTSTPALASLKFLHAYLSRILKVQMKGTIMKGP